MQQHGECPVQVYGMAPPARCAAAVLLALTVRMRTRARGAVSEMPCGHCRQFLNELPTADELRICVPSRQVDLQLQELLPYRCSRLARATHVARLGAFVADPCPVQFWSQ